MKEYFIEMPTTVIFGRGEISQLGKYAKKMGRNPFVIMMPSLVNKPTGIKILRILAENKLDLTLCDNVSPNPRNNAINECAKTCTAADCDFIIAIGGGSTIDTAKAVAVLAANGGDCWEYTTRKNKPIAAIRNKPLPVIAIPTTSGTGAEITPYSVINNELLTQKATISNKDIFPTLAILDPELMVSMPRKLTALTGIDAFSHAFESYINVNSTQFSESIALEAIRLFAENIEVCCNEPKNIHARSMMALSSLYAGIAIAHSPTTLPHAVGQPLGGMKDAPHGATIATCIIPVIQWTLPSSSEKFAKVAETLDPELIKLNISESEKANRLPIIIEEIFKGILDKPVKMSDYGLGSEEVELYVDNIITSFGDDLLNHPKIANRDDLVLIVKASL